MLAALTGLRGRLAGAVAALALVAALVSTSQAATHRGAVRESAAPGTAARAGGAACADPDTGYSGQRNPANPLALATAPGSDPLTGARFFVPGPAKGSAAGAIATLVGDRAALGDLDESWATFDAQLHQGALAAKLAADPKLAHQVAELSKIAAEPEVQRISSYVQGGGPGAIYAQTTKLLCSNLGADPGTIPIFATYFLHADLGGCASSARIRADMPTFHRRVGEMAQAIGRRPAVLLLELDALGSSSCMAKHGSLGTWETALRYEVDTMAALPHAVVYLEAGYSDGNSVRYTARALNKIGIGRIRGFFTNDTHLQWTINEVHWATKISRLTHGAHFIVDTADNGRGPLLNKHPVTQGVEDLCNPPGRGLGPRDTTDTGFAAADAFLWTHPPGNSSGCGGGPPGGDFWPAKAIGEAERANGQLGPGYPSRPY